MTFVIPAEERKAYMSESQRRAASIVKLTETLIREAIQQGYVLRRVQAEDVAKWGAMASTACWVLETPGKAVYFGKTVFDVGRFLTGQMKPNAEGAHD